MGVMQKGDEVIVPVNTYIASVLAIYDIELVTVNDLKKDFGYTPQTPISTGVKKFINLYKNYYERK